MLAQQDIAIAHAQGRVGRRVECVVDARLKGGRWLGRTYGDAPDIDTVIELTGRKLREGSFGVADVTAANEYDLVGTMNLGGKR